MSNINKTSSINHLLGVISSQRKPKVNSQDPSENRKTDSLANRPNADGLKKELVSLIKPFDLSLTDEKIKARKLLINKVIYWQFLDSEASHQELSNLALKVNQQLLKTSQARDRIDDLLLELQS